MVLRELNKRVYTYALIKSLYDQGEDYIDSFWPFTIKVLPIDGKFADLNVIQKSVKENFDLEIPLYTLQTILNRAKRKKYVEQKETQYLLTEKGLQYLDSFETDKEVERRLNALFDDVKQFLDERLNTSASVDEVREALVSLVYNNIEPLTEFFKPSSTSVQPIVSIKATTSFKKNLIEYIDSAENQKPEHYKTLQDMFLGAIISTVLSSEDASRMTEIRTKKIKRCRVFLDTNFIFSVLGLDTPEFNDPAKELFSLLKERRFELKVFSFTVDEICWVINGYPEEEYRYPSTLMVDSLYSSLKRRGWTKTDAKEFVANIEDTLSKLGMQVELVNEIDLKNYNPSTSELRSLMAGDKYKPLQKIFSQNHDLAAIQKIKELRGHPARNIETSKVIFLTSDRRLSKFNFMEMGHRENGTICEVILDSLLTNILWLKNPNAKISLRSMIAVYSRDLFIKRRVWERFYEALRKVKQEQNVSDEAISMLFYHNYIEDSLTGFDEAQIDKITPEFVLEEIEGAAKSKEKEAEEKEREFIQRLNEKVSEKERQKNQEWLEKLQGIKRNIREAAEKSSIKCSVIYASLSTLLLLGIMYGIYLGLKQLGVSDILLWLIPLLIGGSGISGIWSRLRRFFRSKLSNSIYLKKLKEAGLEEIK